jgi:uncharacterized membrane protein
MPDLTEDKPTLSPHIEGTVEAIAAVHAEHYQQATPLQQIVGRATATVGRPVFSVILTMVVLGWVSANPAIIWAGGTPWDAPPFPCLATAASVVALYTTVLILATQRHDDELARHRDQLTLEIAILGEQKSAKIIQMLEEIRNDSPHLENRADQEAQLMSASADPQSILKAIRAAQKKKF